MFLAWLQVARAISRATTDTEKVQSSSQGTEDRKLLTNALNDMLDLAQHSGDIPSTGQHLVVDMLRVLR